MTVIGYALRFLVILPAIILHEISHGWVAYRLGDPTAKNAGRLSLNPVRHIDLWGTILMPALLLLLSGGQFAFGYAKPVPINPRYFGDYRRGMFLTGIAGPTTNIILAAIAGLGVRAVGSAQITAAMTSGASITSFAPATIVGLILWYFCFLNVVLVFFNLIPIPPLDGSRVLPLFLSDRGLQTYHEVERYGFGILLVILFVVPYISQGAIDPIGIYFNYTVYPITQLLSGIV